MTFSHFWASKSDIGMRKMARVEEPVGALIAFVFIQAE